MPELILSFNYLACHWADHPNAQALIHQPLLVRTVSKALPSSLLAVKQEGLPPVVVSRLPPLPSQLHRCAGQSVPLLVARLSPAAPTSV